MLKNDKKTKIIIALAAGCFLVGIGTWIYVLCRLCTYWDFSEALSQLSYSRLSWLVVFCLGGYGLRQTRGWAPESKLLKEVVLILLLTGMAVGLVWFLFAVLAYLITYRW